MDKLSAMAPKFEPGRKTHPPKENYYSAVLAKVQKERDDLKKDKKILKKTIDMFESEVERLKDEVKTIEFALDKINNLRGVEYVWNRGGREGEKDLGVIAQEVEKVIPEIVRDKEMPLMDDSGETYKTVDYEKLTAVLIEGMKEQQKQIDELRQELREMKDGSS